MAVKQVPIIESKDSSLKKIEALQVEIDLLSQLSHVNIVKYKVTTKENEYLNIFLEYEAGGSISSLLQKYGPFSEDLVKIYARQILDGLEYLHIHNVIHRDIKGANVLVHSNGICRLADFGGAKKICSEESQKYNTLTGSPFWMEPEVIRQSGAGRQSDIWSFGCTVVEMLTGNPPFHEVPNKMGLFYLIASTDAKPKIPDHVSDNLKDFLNHCLVREPENRWNVFKLIRHPFLSNAELLYEPSSYPIEEVKGKFFDNGFKSNESQIESSKKDEKISPH